MSSKYVGVLLFYLHMHSSFQYLFLLLKQSYRTVLHVVYFNYQMGVNVTLTYHNVIMGDNQELYLNHAAINTIIMAVSWQSRKGYATRRC